LENPQEVREPIGQLLKKHYPEIQIIGDPSTRVQTRASLRNQGETTLISEIEPQNIDNTMEDEHWVKAMQEELDQFQKNDVWKLEELPKGNKAVGAKWVLRNKLDEAGKVARNMPKLIAKGYSQQESIDYT